MEADHHQQGDEEEADPAGPVRTPRETMSVVTYAGGYWNPMTYVPTVVSIAAGNVETICPGATGDSG